MAKLTDENRKFILDAVSNGVTKAFLARKFGVSVPTIFYVVRGKWAGSKHSSQYTAKYIHKKRLMCIEILGGKCVRCGYDDKRALQIDHINGRNGDKRKSPMSMYKYIINNPEQTEYQLLCANCNWIKRYENHEHRNGISYNDYS